MEEKHQDLDALLAENRRLKQELSRLAGPQAALYRPPWQPQPAEPAESRRRRVSSDVNEATQLPALAPGYPSLRKSVAQSLPVLRRSTSPIADLRRCFLSAGASRAFEQLDVHRSGVLNFHDFQHAVETSDAGFEPSLIVEVFGALAVDGQLSIAKLLDLHPLERTKHMEKMDTQSLFKAYKHKSFGHRNLNRQPRWHEAERRCEFHGYQETLRRRRDLRKQFREDRQGIKTEQKRELVQGIQPLESFSGFREQEQRNMEVHRQRIQDAIRGCSRARYNLVEIQKQMADLVADHDEEREVTFAFKDLFRNNVARTEAELASDRGRFTLTPKARKQKSVIFGSVDEDGPLR